jgi:hypothetical protein
MPEGVGDIKQVLSWAGALSASAVIPHPIATFVGAVIGGLAGEVVEEGVSDFALLQQSRLLDRLRPLRNADLERAAIRALRDALRVAKRELKNQTGSGNLPRGLSDDEVAVFRKWDEQLENILKVPDEQLLAATPNMPSDAPTLTALTKESLADTLLTQLRKLAESTTIPESLEHFLKAQLPAIFQTHYSEVLKDPTYNRAWIAFQRQMLEAIFQAIGELPGYIRTLIDEQVVRKQEEILSLLKAEPERWEQRAQKLIQDIKEPILEAIKFNQQQLDYIVELLGEKHYCRLLHEATLRFLDLSMQEVFVGREAILDDLERFTVKRRRGLAVLFAPAGYGKTRLMMRLLARLQARGDIQTVYHFFTSHEALEGLGTRVEYAYAHLLLQLGALQGTTISLPDANPDELRAMLYYQLKELSRAQKPLVILIDGLDEADEPISYPPLPEPLPDGVFVIVSARWDGQSEPPSYLQAWHKRANHVFSLETLREDDLREWLLCEESLRRYAANAEFIRTLHQRTEGLPLYARYLIDDLRKAQDPRQKLHDAPQGIRNYIRQQVSHIAQHVSNAQGVRQMFALLTVTKGALPDSDLIELTDLSDFDLENLPQPIGRWFLRSQLGWQFQHPRLAAEFRRALPNDAKQMERKLLEYCARWDEHKSPYALRYYAAHLAERAISDPADAEHLYALMENGDFLQAQRAAFPDQPELPLSLMRQAIEVASARDEPVPLAKALLLHAQRVGGIRLQSPARIWRETGNLEYALKVADLYPPRMRPLWYLLLAREQPNPEQRKGILDRLAQQVSREKAPLSLFDAPPYCDIAFALLIKVANDIDEATFTHLKPLFSEQNWLRWLNRLVDEGSYALARQWFEWFRTHLELSDLFELAKIQGRLGLYTYALASAEGIEDVMMRSIAFRAIAVLQAQAGLYDEAFRTTQRIENIGQRNVALREIAVSQALKGLYDEAFRTTQRIENIGQRNVALREIAVSQALKGLYDDAFHTAQKIEDVWLQSEVLSEITVLQAQAGLCDAALHIAQRAVKDERRTEAVIRIADVQADLYDKALHFAQGFENEEAGGQDIAMCEIVASQSQAGLYDEAIYTAQKIEDVRRRGKALREISKFQSRAGLYGKAIHTAQKIEDVWLRSEALHEVAVLQAQAGLYDEAFHTAQKIEDVWLRSEALHEVAVLQAQAGLYDEAIHTAQKIEDVWCRGKALREISKFQARVDGDDNSSHLAEGAGREEQQSETVAGIAEAETDLCNRASHITHEVEEKKKRGVALREIAVFQARAGFYDDALRTAQTIEDTMQRSKVLCEIAVQQAQAGAHEEAVRTAHQVYDNDYFLLSHVVKSLIETGDRHYFKQLLSPAAYSLPAALRACAALMRAYPNHAREISAVVMQAISS